MLVALPLPEPASDDATLPLTPGPRSTPRVPDSQGSAAPDGETPSLGRVGDYELLQPLGAGGMGRVYLARDTRLRRRAAVKMMHGGAAVSPMARDRFRAEARTLARIDHPNVVKCWGDGEEDGIPWMAMQLVAGEALSARLGDYCSGPATRECQDAAAGLTAMVARALHAVHIHGVLHRDVKPSNIMLDGSQSGSGSSAAASGTNLPNAVLVDFGLARDTGEESATLTGETMGTVAWMAPEVMDGGGHAATPWSDQYSAGVVLYQLLTGELPFGKDSLMNVRGRMRSGPPPAPLKLRPGISRELEAICLRSLEMNPESRYGSCQAFAEDLEAWRAGREISARPAGAVRKVWLWCRWHPLAASLAVLSLTAAGLGTRHLLQERATLQARLEQAASARREAVRETFSAAAAAHSRHDGPGFSDALTRFQRLAAEDGGWDASAALLEAAARESQIPLPGVSCLSGSAEGFVAGNEDGTITLGTHAGAHTVLPAPWTGVRGNAVRAAVAFREQAGGATYVIAGYARTGLCLWWLPEAASKRPLCRFQSLPDPADQIALSPDHAQMFLCCRGALESAGVRVRDTRTGALLRTLPGGSGPLAHALAAPVFAQGLPGNLIRVWDTRDPRDFKVIAEIATGATATALALSPDGTRLAWTEDGPVPEAGRARLARADGRGIPEVLPGRSRSPQHIAFSLDGAALAAGDDAGVVDLWPLGTEGAPSRSLQAHRGAVNGIAFCGADTFPASSSAAGSLHLPLSAVLTAPGAHQISAGPDGWFFRMNAASDAVLAWKEAGYLTSIPVQENPEKAPGTSRPEQRLAGGRYVGSWFEIATVTGSAGDAERVLEIHGHTPRRITLAAPRESDAAAATGRAAESWAISPDFSLLAQFQSRRSAVVSWTMRDAATGAVLWEAGYDSPVVLAERAAEFSPDGALVALGSGTLQIRQARSGALLFSLEEAGAFAFSPDSTRCAVIVGGKKLRVLDCATWQTLLELPDTRGARAAVRFLGNNHTLVLPAAGGRGVRVLDTRGTRPELSAPLFAERNITAIHTSGASLAFVDEAGAVTRLGAALQARGVEAAIMPPDEPAPAAQSPMRWKISATEGLVSCLPSPAAAEVKWALGVPRPFGAMTEGGAAWRFTFAPLPAQIRSARLTLHLQKPPETDLRCSAHSLIHMGLQPGLATSLWRGDLRVLCGSAAEGTSTSLTIDLADLQGGKGAASLLPAMNQDRCLDVVIGSLASVSGMELEVDAGGPFPEILTAENSGITISGGPPPQPLQLETSGAEVTTGTAAWTCQAPLVPRPFIPPQGWSMPQPVWIGPEQQGVAAARAPVTFTCRFDTTRPGAFRAWLWALSPVQKILLNGQRLPELNTPTLRPGPDTPVLLEAPAHLLKPSGNELTITVQGLLPAILVKGGVGE